MCPTWFRWLMTATSVVALTRSVYAEDPAHSVRDGAALFSPNAVRDASDAIQEIQRVYRKRVVVETFTAPSRFKTWVLKLKKPENRGRFYEDWARELARKAGPDSIIVLMCREPAPIHVAVAAGRYSARHGFAADACQRLEEKLRDPVARGAFDASLYDGIVFVRQTLDGNRLKGASADEAFSWGGVLVAMAASLGAWLFLMSLRRIQLMKAGTSHCDELTGINHSTSVSYLAGIFAGMNTPWPRELARGWREDRLHALQDSVSPGIAQRGAFPVEHGEPLWAEAPAPTTAFDTSHSS